MNTVRNFSKLGVLFGFVSVLSACGGGGESGGSGGATLPATTGVLQSLSIAPATASTTACLPVQFIATAKYSDNSTLDVTNAVSWAIDPATSSVAVANPTTGQVYGTKVGTANVIAWTGQGIAATGTLSVTAGGLSAITVTPASALLAVSGTQTLTAVASCSNATTLDISSMGVWTSSSPSVATVSSLGVAKATTTINANAGGVVGSAALTVQ